jgi:CDP-diacylglycerol pyrophosphatase
MARECRRTTEVWAATADYVAIRDIKMCGCGRDFAHGLALPRHPVSGLEDSRRPAGIWSFAWDVARQRITEEDAIALVVNPPSLRTQDQLHVHLVRLKPGVRASLAADSARVPSLDAVWGAAAHRRAEIPGDYGVLVARDGDQFLVFAGGGPLEQRFTVGECR